MTRDRSTTSQRGRWFIAIVAMIAIALACVWTIVARRELRSSIAREVGSSFERSRRTFELLRQRRQDSLRTDCRLLVEDPRVKSTLATEGMDEATVSDILRDLIHLRGRGFLLVLAPNGHVFAEAGADELRGLDLSQSAVVKSAQASSEVVVGSWVIGNRLVDLGVMTVRLDTAILAYLVVGESIDRPFLEAFGTAEDVTAAIFFGSDLSTISTDDAGVAAALRAFARDEASTKPRVIQAGDAELAASIADLDQSAQSRPRLVLARPLKPSSQLFALLGWLLLVPPILVVVILLLATSRGSSRAS